MHTESVHPSNQGERKNKSLPQRLHERDITPVSLGIRQELDALLHHVVRHVAAEPGASALAEEDGQDEPELHLGQVHAEAAARAQAPWLRQLALLVGSVEEARLVEPVVLMSAPGLSSQLTRYKEEEKEQE